MKISKWFEKNHYNPDFSEGNHNHMYFNGGLSDKIAERIDKDCNSTDLMTRIYQKDRLLVKKYLTEKSPKKSPKKVVNKVDTYDMQMLVSSTFQKLLDAKK